MAFGRRIVAVAALVFLAGAAYAHDIPADVTVQLFVKPDGQALRVMVRVPLQAMRDMDYPKPHDARNADLLDLAHAEPTLRDAATLWIADYLDLYENGTLLPAPRVVSVRAALQSDKSFASYDDALAHLAAPGLPVDTEFFWSQGLLDVQFEYPIASEQSRFSIAPRLARLGIRTLTVLRFLPPAGGVRSFEFVGDPGLVPLEPLWRETVVRFLELGCARLIDSADQLLFVVVLVAPFRRIRSIVALMAAFIVAQSLALVAADLGIAPDALWFPPLVDTLIAASIIYMALENVVITSRFAVSPISSGTSLKRRWIATFAFGVAHGFASAFVLKPALQLAGSHPWTAMLSFNAGVELAQVVVVVLLVPALALLARFLVGDVLGVILVSALAGHAGWHWMVDRWELLRKFTFEWPTIDAVFLAGALRWMMLLVVAAGCYWLVFSVIGPAMQFDRQAE
jgi:HupE / UreJ protein